MIILIVITIVSIIVTLVVILVDVVFTIITTVCFVALTISTSTIIMIVGFNIAVISDTVLIITIFKIITNLLLVFNIVVTVITVVVIATISIIVEITISIVAVIAIQNIVSIRDIWTLWGVRSATREISEDSPQATSLICSRPPRVDPKSRPILGFYSLHHIGVLESIMRSSISCSIRLYHTVPSRSLLEF